MTGWVHVKVVDAGGRVTARRLIRDIPGTALGSAHGIRVTGDRPAGTDVDAGFPVPGDTWQGRTLTWQATFTPGTVTGVFTGAELLTAAGGVRARAGFAGLATTLTDTLIVRWQQHEHDHDHDDEHDD